MQTPSLILNGFLLGISIIAALGPQNIFLLRQGLRGQHVAISALCCSLSDALLFALSITAAGTLIGSFPSLKQGLLIFAVVFLFCYGTKSIARSTNTKIPKSTDAVNRNMQKTVLVALSLSLLNPLALIDTLVIVGGVAANYAPEDRLEFVFGAAFASFSWFFGIAYGAKMFSSFFRKPRVWQITEMFGGTLMILIAIKLLFGK